MDFNLFMYCTIGRPQELKAGMAGKRPELYQRMLQEIAEYVRVAGTSRLYRFRISRAPLQIEGFEVANEPTAKPYSGGRVFPAHSAGHSRARPDSRLAGAFCE